MGLRAVNLPITDFLVASTMMTAMRGTAVFALDHALCSPA